MAGRHFEEQMMNSRNMSEQVRGGVSLSEMTPAQWRNLQQQKHEASTAAFHKQLKHELATFRQFIAYQRALARRRQPSRKAAVMRVDRRKTAAA